MTMTPVLLADWLADAGLRNLPLEQMVDGFSRRLNEMGVAVARTFVGTNTLHPMVRARSMIWDRLTGPGTHFEFNHAEIDAPAVPAESLRPHDPPWHRRATLRSLDASARARDPRVRGVARGGHDRVVGTSSSRSASSRPRSAGRPKPSAPTSSGSSAR